MRSATACPCSRRSSPGPSRSACPRTERPDRAPTPAQLSRRERHRLRHGSYGLTENWDRVDGQPVRSLSLGRRTGLPEIVMLAGMGAPGYLAPWVRLSSEWTRATVVDLPGWTRGRARSCAPDRGRAWPPRWPTGSRPGTCATSCCWAIRSGRSSSCGPRCWSTERLSGVVLAGPSFPPDVRRARTLSWRFVTTIPREPADEIASIAPSFLSSGGPGLFRLLSDGMAQRPEDQRGQSSTSRSWS